MFKLVVIFLLVLFSACRTKYDTSNAVAILETNTVLPDYRLQKERATLDSTENVVNIEGYEVKHIKNLGKKFHGELYFEGLLYTVSSKELLIFDLENNIAKKVQHNLGKTVNFSTASGVVLLYDPSGKFAFVDSNSYKVIWEDVLDGVNEFASLFACVEEKSSCYALTIDGKIVTLNYQSHSVNKQKFFQRNDVVLSELYQPIVFDAKVVFGVGQSQFAIFDTKQNAVIAQSSFVENSGVLFDINLVKNMYQGGGHVVISHLNGAYAFSILYNRTLWSKKFIFNNAFIVNNYIFFYEEGAQKLIALHLDTGEAKWVKDTQLNPIKIYITYEKKLIVAEDKGLSLFDVETGDDIVFKEINMHDVSYIFVHNNIMHYVKNGKVYKIQ